MRRAISNSNRRRRALGALAGLTILTMAASATALAARTSTHSTAHLRATHSLNIRVGNRRAHIMTTPRGARPADMINGPLLYHGGPVMASGVLNVIILWNPGALQDSSPTGYSASYASLAQRWFTDQPQSSLYGNMNQYSMTTTKGPKYILPNTKKPKVLTDTDPFPVGQCVHPTTGTNCITDANIVAELDTYITAHLLHTNLATEYFVMTPAGEGSCFDSSCFYPSYTYYCAYHSFSTASPATSTKPLIYANMPYPTDPGGFNCYGGSGQTYPSGDVNADANVNLISHEEDESVTDPLLNAWYDATGLSGEIGDVCAWQFGSTFPSGGDLQTNGHPYDTQSEGSNHNLSDEGGTGCVYAGP